MTTYGTARVHIRETARTRQRGTARTIKRGQYTNRTRRGVCTHYTATKYGGQHNKEYTATRGVQTDQYISIAKIKTTPETIRNKSTSKD